MKILLSILVFIVLFVLLFLAIYVCNKYLFRKVKINKYIPLSLALICLILAFLVRNISLILNLVITLVAVIFFACFFDINQNGTAKTQKNIKIKNKAKPNRVIHNKDIIVTKKNKKN